MRIALAAVTAVLLTVPIAVEAAEAAGSAVAGVTAAATTGGPLGPYHPVSRVRVLDSRSSGMIQAGDTVPVPVTGSPEVPATGVMAVSANLTVLTPARTGSISTFADGTSWSGATMSFHAGQTVQNEELIPVSADGRLDIRNNTGTALAVIVDILGYYATAAAGPSEPMTPARVLDTRSAGSQPLGAGQAIRVQVAGRAGLPQSSNASVITFTVLTPSQSGSLSVWSYDGTPNTPSISFTAGQTEQSQLRMMLDGGGALSVRNNSTAAIQLIADVAGYGISNYTGWGGYVRGYDSRSASYKPVPPGGTVQVQARLALWSLWGPIVGDIADASMNVTVLTPAAGGSISLWPADAGWDGAATISFTAGQTMQRMLLQRTPAFDGLGTVNVRNNSSASVNLVVDLNGWTS